MFSPKSPTKRLLGALALSGCLLTGVQAITWADSNPGLTIFSGVDRENILSYHLDFGGRGGGWDRYRLRIPGKKMTQGAAKFFIVYPEYYDGQFDVDSIEVRIKGESLPLREVYWDKESQQVEIDLENPIVESNKVEIVFSNVKNPRFGGTFYFHCHAVSAGNIPLRLYLGTWILSINR
ncbi:MAG: DUF2808 domain-containing protein [Xenococcaceae cyanobacterium]